MALSNPLLKRLLFAIGRPAYAAELRAILEEAQNVVTDVSELQEQVAELEGGGGGGSTTGLNDVVSVKVASVGGESRTSAPAEIDGVPLEVGDLVLLKNHGGSGARYNGVYTFNGEGQAMTRATGWDTAENYTTGLMVYVESGVENQFSVWILRSKVTTIDSDTQSYFEFGATPNAYGVTFTGADAGLAAEDVGNSLIELAARTGTETTLNLTLGGAFAGVEIAVRARKAGKLVTLQFPNISVESGPGGNMSATLPAGWQPATQACQLVLATSGASEVAVLSIDGADLDLAKDVAGNPFDAGNGAVAPFTISYFVP